MITTTLNQIRETSPKPCKSGWEALLAHLGKTKADDVELPMSVVLDAIGLDDTLWVLGETLGLKFMCALIAADYAESVLHFFEREWPNDTRPREAITIARNPAAWAAAGVAARAARVAARDAGVAARDAAWAAGAAAGGAAWAAAWAAGAAARAAAWAAARDAGVAARGAARDSQKERLHQYLEHGESAKDLPWDTGVAK